MCACPLDGKPDVSDAPPLELQVRDENHDGIGGSHPPLILMEIYPNARSILRKQIRKQRRKLSAAEGQIKARKLSRLIAASRIFQKSRNIAFYLTNDGEIDLLPLIKLAWKQKKRCYLPVLGLSHSRSLWFLPYTPTTKLYRNSFGINEPKHKRHTRQFKVQSLDLVFMPLVAFDKQGNRLGMGGGFYDRTLAFLHNRRQWRKPCLIGAAFSFQKVNKLETRVWDVPLHGVVTDQEFRVFSHID